MYDSNLPEAYTAMGLSYFIWGKLEEAGGSGRKAIELDPDDFIACWTLGRIHFSTGKFEEALELFQRVIDIKPQFYVALHRPDADLRGPRTEAEAAASHAAPAGDDAQLPAAESGRLARAHVLCDHAARNRPTKEAHRRRRAALALSPGDSVMLYNGACLYARLGDTRRAVATLREAIAAGVTNYGWMKHDPDLDPIRNDPEFISLFEKQ